MRGEAVHQIHVPFALLASGWRRDVLITIDGRLIGEVAADVPAPPPPGPSG
jgi:hypothetical protein